MITVGIQTGRISGVSFYRQYQPLLWLQEHMPEEFKLIMVDDKNLGDLIADVDIYFHCSPGGVLHDETFSKLREFNAKAVEKGLTDKLRFVLDYDDSIDDITPSNPAYIFSGTEECKVEFGEDTDTPVTVNWDDRETVKAVNGTDWVYDIARNKRMIAATEKVKKEADALFCTTDYLKGKLTKHNPNVHVLPNAIDLSLYEREQKDTGKVRIGWAFSSSHWEDYFDVRKALTEVINSRDDVTLVLLMGDAAPTYDLDMNKVEIYPYTDVLKGYHKLFSRLNLDIGLAHITDNEFNKCKSPLKWMEYAATNTATLAPNTLYGDYITDGETGSLYSNKTEFVGKLNQLIDSKKLRQHLTGNALTMVDEKYSIEKIAPMYLDAFKKVIAQ